MKKQLFNMLVVFALASLVLAACGGKANSASGMKTEVGDGEGEVSIISWAG